MSQPALPLRPPVFAILSALIEEQSGLHYTLDDLDLIADKLSLRAVEAGFDSLLDYYYYLRYDPAAGPELDAMLNSLVVHETYFFRELDSLERMLSDFIEPLVAAGKRPRIWCAACATGEEAFTIAMLLADKGLLGKVEILASDLSERALTRARAGEYGLRSLRHDPPSPLAARYLSVSAGRVRVADELKDAIQFRRINLVDAAAFAALGRFDLIVCRNVMIYFSEVAIRRVVGSLIAALVPAGALLVGVSESLLRLGTSLSCEERGGVFFYRKQP